MSTASDALSLEKWRAVVGSAGERLSLEKWRAGHRLAPCRARPTERKSLQTTCAPVDPRSTAPIVRAVVTPCPRPIPCTSPRLLHPKRASSHHMRPCSPLFPPSACHVLVPLWPKNLHGCRNRSGEVIRRVRPDDTKVDFGTRAGPDWIPVSGILVPGRPGHRMSGFTVPGRTSTGPDSPE